MHKYNLNKAYNTTTYRFKTTPYQKKSEKECNDSKWQRCEYNEMDAKHKYLVVKIIADLSYALYPPFYCRWCVLFFAICIFSIFVWLFSVLFCRFHVVRFIFVLLFRFDFLLSSYFSVAFMIVLFSSYILVYLNMKMPNKTVVCAYARKQKSFKI